MGTYNFTDTFRLSFGGRYQDVDKGGVLTPTVGSLLPGATEYEPFVPFPAGGPTAITGLNADDSDFLPEVGIQYDFGDDTMFYAKYSEAFKAGGFIMAPAPAGMFPNPPDYRPEYAEGIEVGVKSRIGNNVEVNVGIYDTDYTDLQVTIFDPQTSSFYTSNAAEANTKGVEIDGRWAAGDNFSLGFTGALSDAKYVSRPGAQECNSLVTKQWVVDGNGPASTCSVDLSGVAMPYQPDWSVGLMPRFDFMLGNMAAYFTANMFFSDGYRLGDDMHPDVFVDDVTRIDLRLAFMPGDGDWEIAIYGRDVTDEMLQVGGGERNFQSRSVDFVYDTGGRTYERGARYGVQFGYFFGN